MKTSNNTYFTQMKESDSLLIGLYVKLPQKNGYTAIKDVLYIYSGTLSFHYSVAKAVHGYHA